MCSVVYNSGGYGARLIFYRSMKPEQLEVAMDLVFLPVLVKSQHCLPVAFHNLLQFNASLVPRPMLRSSGWITSPLREGLENASPKLF